MISYDVPKPRRPKQIGKHLLVRQIPSGTEEDKRIRIEVRHFHRSRGFFYMSPKLMAHCGQNSIGKISIAAGTESLIKRDTQNSGRDRFINCGLDRPASLARV